MDRITVVYNHPAVPPKFISMNKGYILFITEDGIYINSNKEKHFFTEDRVKLLFKIVDKNLTWDDVFKKGTEEIKEDNNIEVLGDSDVSEKEKEIIENIGEIFNKKKKKVKK